MGHDHKHASSNANIRNLWIALGLTSTFLVVEFVGSLLTGSLALLSDAAHMLTDVSALIISLIAIRIAQKAADNKRTFGYYRLEILAATFNALLLFLVAIYILYEAYERFENPPEIHAFPMLVIAAIGLIVNIISMRLLSAGKNNSLNIKSAYLEVWSDMLGSVGVIVGALLIQFTGLTWIDSIIAVGIGLWVLPRTWLLLKDAINILLEGVPKEIDINKLRENMLEVPGVINIHELHVWAITSGKLSLTAHVVIEDLNQFAVIVGAINKILVGKFGITHSTLQPENQCCKADSPECNM